MLSIIDVYRLIDENPTSIAFVIYVSKAGNDYQYRNIDSNNRSNVLELTSIRYSIRFLHTADSEIDFEMAPFSICR